MIIEGSVAMVVAGVGTWAINFRTEELYSWEAID
jgi:hypothetical protein